ncbi:hypothetical protein ACFE04_003273 [Oxalis oulophora]
MNPVINRSIQTSISIPCRKFISSVAESQLTYFDPLQFFKDYTKSKHCNFKNTQTIHTHLLKNTTLLQSNVFISNYLLNWYLESGSTLSAHNLFDLIPNRNDISWNTLISGYNKNLLHEDSLNTFCKMRVLGFEPTEFTYGSVLSACAALQASIFGKLVYSLVIKNGFFFNGYVRVGMIDLFAKSGSFQDALNVFYDVTCDNVVCWNAIISGAERNTEYTVALDLFRRMCRASLLPNSFTFSSVFTASKALEEFEIGKCIQSWVIKCGAQDVFVCTAIVDLYAKCGEMEEAVKEFSSMPQRNVVSWTAVISGFVQQDDSLSALELFKEMRDQSVGINIFTLTSVIKACAKPNMIKEAMQIHSLVLKSGFYMDPVIGSALINMYSKLRALNLCEMVFEEVGYVKNSGILAAMISSSAQNHNSKMAIALYRRILSDGLKPDTSCSSSVLRVIDRLDFGRQIHGYILKTGLLFDVMVGSSLFTMYSKCGSLEDSFEVFKQISDRDNVCWTSMIAGFTEHGHGDQAIQLFKEMLCEETRPDKTTLSSILKACSVLQSLHKGKEIHSYALRAGFGKETVFGGALVNMYAKCGALGLARRVFDMLPQKDEISCSALVSGYAQNGLLEDALILFHNILMSGFSLDSFTLSSILGAVKQPIIGTQLHALATKMGFESDVSVGSSLVTMYSKSGSMENCCKAFDQIGEPDLISWSAMIASYAQHGKGEEALKLYELMRKRGVRPDSVTFVEILSACSHNGFVEEGYFYFNSMSKEFGIQPNYHHYACMVDLLGRLGRLKEAENFISEMPIEANALVWSTLLAACKVHGDVEIGRLAAKKVMELKPSDSGAFVSLSNIFAEAGQWEDVIEVRSLMKDTGLSKEAAVLATLTPELQRSNVTSLKEKAWKPIVVKHGLNHITYLIEQNKAQLVVIAHEVDLRVRC